MWSIIIGAAIAASAAIILWKNVKGGKSPRSSCSSCPYCASCAESRNNAKKDLSRTV